MDASDYAIGGYLYQVDAEGREQIIAYGGRKLNLAERMYPTREKEPLAALHAMRTWKVYLIDKPFFIDTDHRTIEALLHQSTCSQRLARWLNELSLFQPRFRWIAGETNIVADAVSRSPQLLDGDQPSHVSIGSLLEQIREQQSLLSVDEAFQHYIRQRPSVEEQCKRLYASDPILGPLVHYLARGAGSEATPVDLSKKSRANVHHFFIADGLLFYQPDGEELRRLCVPADTDLRNTILFEHHDTLSLGHPGTQKTLLAVQRKFYWPNMKQTVAKYVQTCELCQRVKASHRKPAGLLHPLEIPHARWSHISLDFMPDLPPSSPDRYDTILVVLDRLTKRAHFLPTRKSATAKDTARLFVREHVRLHGFPSSIVSDRDSRFLSAFWKAVTESQRTQIRASTAFKPSTDGQNERSHGFINDYMRAFISPTQDDWFELLPMAEFAYNSRSHSSIGMSPFAADLGYEPQAFADLAFPGRPNLPRDALSFVEHHHSVLQRCRDAVETANANMKHQFDKNRPDEQYTIGDLVLLDTLHLDLAHVGTKGRRKFAARFIGPYKILAATTPKTYRISLPPGVRLHDEFHVSYLRRYHEDTNPHRLNDVPRLITRDGTEGQQIRAIVGRREHHGELQYKVRWPLTTPTYMPPLTPRQRHTRALPRERDGRFVRAGRIRAPIRVVELGDATQSDDTDADADAFLQPVGGEESVYELTRIWAMMRVNSVDFYLVQWTGYEELTWEPRCNIPWQVVAHFHRDTEYAAWRLVSARGNLLPTMEQGEASHKKTCRTAGSAASCRPRATRSPAGAFVSRVPVPPANTLHQKIAHHELNKSKRKPKQQRERKFFISE
ncbi:hypothetical protein ATCC90586_011580 [Pythium insidiosum]|nr:hypothetical protein ATCC90586_011580 [Pythium insidiosum]